MISEKCKHVTKNISAADSYNEDSNKENCYNFGGKSFDPKILFKKLKYIILF